jgi:hypothetical protein
MKKIKQKSLITMSGIIALLLALTITFPTCDNHTEDKTVTDLITGLMWQKSCDMNRWMDVHGAGAQRSDPKIGDPDDFPTGRGPQGDAIRIYNYVRLVRNIK